VTNSYNDVTRSASASAIPAQGVAYPHPAQAWWAVAVFCFALVIAFTDRLILGALVDPIKQSLDVSDSAIGLIQGAAFVVIYVLSGLVLGRLADRKRRLTILVVGATMWSIGTVACGLVSSYWQLILARAVVGVGEAGLGPAAVSIVVDSFPPTRRGSATSIVFLGAYLGAPASIAIGGVMLSLANAGYFTAIPVIGILQPWRLVLVLVGLGGLTVPALFLTLREPPRQGGARALPLGLMVKQLIADRRALVPLYLAMGLMNVGDYGVFAWVPSALSRGFSLPPGKVGTIFGLITGIAGALGCLVAGSLSDAAARRYGARGRLYFALAGALAAALGAALIGSASVSLVLIGLSVWVLFSAITNIGGIAALQNLIPPAYSGIGIALLAFCNVLLGLGLGPVLVPMVTENIYGDPASVGLAITTVVAPTAMVAATLFLCANRAAKVRMQAV
jgi:predicted MFS family arabinose efflux permease